MRSQAWVKAQGEDQHTGNASKQKIMRVHTTVINESVSVAFQPRKSILSLMKAQRRSRFMIQVPQCDKTKGPGLSSRGAKLSSERKRLLQRTGAAGPITSLTDRLGFEVAGLWHIETHTMSPRSLLHDQTATTTSVLCPS